VVIRSEGSSGGIWRRRRGAAAAAAGENSGGNNFICSLELPALPRTASKEDNPKFTGPRLNLKLPSFSGATPECPGLLKYACDLSARVRLVKPVVVRTRRSKDEKRDEREGGCSSDDSFLSAVLGGKPLLCLEFGDMRMRVEQPRAALVGEGNKKSKGKKSRGALLA